MSLPNYLAKIKSSGIYRFVWDKSEIAGVDAEILRLVVGYSDKGPFNTPVYVKSEAEFKSIFGDISKKLEKRGAYFHRMALQCLAKGPILALNLKKFVDEKVQGAAFDVIGENITPIEIPVESVYDTTRFWKLSPEDAHKQLCANKTLDTNNYMSIVTTDSKDSSCTIIMRGYHPTGYDVTVAKWYAAQGEERPEYFEGYTDMLVSDFFAEVYVFKGKFTASLCSSEPLKQYFDIDTNGNPVLKEYIVNAFGEKVDTLPLLAADAASNLVNSYSGCLLPYFKSSTGSYISLDLLFNADNHLHKMMMNFDSDLLYNGTIKPSEIATTGWLDSQSVVLGTTLKKTELVFSYTNNVPVYDSTNSIITGFDYGYSEEKSEKAPTCFDADVIKYTNEVKNLTYVNFSGCIYRKSNDVETYECYEAVVGKFRDMDVIYKKGDEFYSAPNAANKMNDKPNVITDDTKAYMIEIYNTEGTSVEKTVYGYKADNSSDKNGKYRLINGDEVGNVYIEGKNNINPIKFDVPEQPTAIPFDELGLVIGDRVLYTASSSSQKMYTIAEIYSDKIVVYDSEGNKQTISDSFVKCNHSCSITNSGLKPIYFEGYTLSQELAKPGLDMLSKLKWQTSILSAITEYPGIRLALTNRTDIDYRYIVDTFEAFVDTEVHKELALICKEKDNALGFLNFPSAKTFRDCPYTSFTDQNNRFQVKYIAEGGNRQKNPGRLFTLVSEDNGASFVSYNTPLTFSDGTVKTNVPSAAMVSNNFMEKYLSRQPYYIVAGPTYGRMIANGLVGPDFNYSRADLDILEPMGVNAMVYVPRLGTYINSNQTAKQNPKTALSSINVRELVIYLQDEIEKLLQDYQWEFNTPGLRELIKAKADVICERVKNNGGIYDFLNVCDESNNTNDVIDDEMFVLSTSIEPGRGAGKMVQELTIYKTGGMQSIIR